jgi:hypothetical protein
VHFYGSQDVLVEELDSKPDIANFKFSDVKMSTVIRKLIALNDKGLQSLLTVFR